MSDEHSESAGEDTSVTISTVFDKLQTAADHEERADRLRSEAKREVLQSVADTLPFEAEMTVKVRGKAFEIVCVPHGVTESLAEEFPQPVTVSTPLRFILGEREQLTQGTTRGIVKQLVSEVAREYDAGAPLEVVLERAPEYGLSVAIVETELEALKEQGAVYEPIADHFRTT